MTSYKIITTYVYLNHKKINNLKLGLKINAIWWEIGFSEYWKQIVIATISQGVSKMK